MTDAHEPAPGEPSARQRLWAASRTAAKLLSNERPFTAAERLAELADSPNAHAAEPVDAYGDGIVETLEARIAALLGKPAACWFPSGTMAQQAILRVWAERAGTSRVAVHPLHHTQVNEESAFTEVSGLEPVALTAERRQPTAEDLTGAPGPLAAAVVELPMQELGYVLPSWDEYTRFAAAAHERGIPLHIDGARIWESQHGFDRSAADIAALGSSVYVSLYKGLGGLSGAAVAAESEVVADARLWRTRYGGDLFHQFPAVVSALDGLDARLDRLAEWTRCAERVARGFASLPGVIVTPSPPDICEFWVYADYPADALESAVLDHLEAHGERWVHGWWTGDDGRAVAEVTVRDPALSWSADDVERVGRAVLERAARITGS